MAEAPESPMNSTSFEQLITSFVKNFTFSNASRLQVSQSEHFFADKLVFISNLQIQTGVSTLPNHSQSCPCDSIISEPIIPILRKGTCGAILLYAVKSFGSPISVS